VYRVEGGGARLVPVDVGAMTDAAAEIRHGLAAGDTVVVFPSDKVADGVRLRVRTRN
jgi:HlyD family secretion protein